MGKTLVTGATGFLGSHVAAALASRGDDLRLAVRADLLQPADHETVVCDILDRRAVRRAMRGVERVFHVAGLVSLRAGAHELARVNGEGAQIVLEEALRAGVGRVVHTSSVAAIGPAPRGRTADERQIFPTGARSLPYAASKYAGEQHALRLAEEEGLPVVIVNPGHMFGAGARRPSSTEIVRRFLHRQIPVYVDGAINVVDVDDVAAGHLLADERGRVGERYILGNRNFTLDRLFADLGRLSGVEPPPIKLPRVAALAVAEAVAQLVPDPPITPLEVRAASQWWAYRSTKAKRELGYSPGPHEEALRRTIAWHREIDDRPCAPPGTRQPLPLRLLGTAIGAVDGALRLLR